MTPKQAAVYNFVADFWAKFSHGPSYQEIADGCGFKARANVHHVVQALKKRRLIEHHKGMRRWIIPVRPDLLKKRKFSPGTWEEEDPHKWRFSKTLKKDVDVPVNGG